ncbi:ABC transporter permease subunit [Paenibacillus puldeungensis]|uniref:ABC transporter permease subunit n=1 Tax=Paenibacillus puldeungensis TaxID=696536 RepID=A0ABW3RW53_9BACL
MSNLLKHRWYEIRHNPIFWITLAVCCAFALLVTNFTGLKYLTDPPMVVGISYNIQGFFSALTADIIFPLLIISGAFTAMMLGQMYSERTIDQEIAAGHSRISIFASQCIIGFAVPNIAVFLAIFSGCLRWVGSIPAPSAGEMLPYLFRVIILLLLLNFSLFSVCTFIVVLFRDTAKTITISALFLLVACWTMPALEQVAPHVHGTLYTNAPSLSLLLHPAFLMRYVLYSTLTPLQGLWSAGVAIGWTVLFLGIAYCVFRRCELK